MLKATPKKKSSRCSSFLLTTSLLLSMNLVESQQQEKCNSLEKQLKCVNQKSCDECLLADPCCNWCFDKSYGTEKEGRSQCNILDRLNDCPVDKIEKNVFNNITVTHNMDFKNDADINNAVQVKPQRFDIVLRRDGTPVTIEFSYKPVLDYPLELYFLGDLSLSMLGNLNYMKTLGVSLGQTLESLTKNFKIAYGSFQDKIGMPFYWTHPENYNNPCALTDYDICETGYLFKHSLNFTRNMDDFSKKIQSSKVTANIDDLDGALDAILQILVCPDIIRWTNSSRKIIVLPTDSYLHTAGDGKLLGAVLRPTEKCLIDKDGSMPLTLKYDYPTIEQIGILLRQKKVNVVFAVKTKTKFDYYETVRNDSIKESGFVVELKEDSRNVLEVIKEGYENFAEQVTFYINTTQHEHLGVRFYADCDGWGYSKEENSTCYGVKDKTVKFKAEIYLKDGSIDVEEETVYIEERSLNERIELSIKYPKLCKCKGIENGDLKCEHGQEKCGKCECNEYWTGESCEKPCDDVDINACRQVVNGEFSSTCHRRGDCLCGKCECNVPYVGDYCEFECPFVGRQICGGKGKCYKGNCICDEGYGGVDCTCETTQKNCDFDGVSCSERGECECNKCKCMDGYRGKYCEKLKADIQNNTICEKFYKYFDDIERNSTIGMNTNNNYSVVIDEVRFLQPGDTCNYLSSRCSYEFAYDQNEKMIRLSTIKNCAMSASSIGIIGGAIVAVLVVVAGLILIIFKKCHILHQERVEFEKFQNEQKNVTEISPIYKSPVTEYTNPMSK